MHDSQRGIRGDRKFQSMGKGNLAFRGEVGGMEDAGHRALELKEELSHIFFYKKRVARASAIVLQYDSSHEAMTYPLQQAATQGKGGGVETKLR